MGKLYDSDFYSWAVEQADAIKRKSLNEIDWENVAEEIESLARSDLRELRSRYQVLIMHLLKWLLQPSGRGRSWRNTISLQRLSIQELLDESPGMKPLADDAFARAYKGARIAALRETNIDEALFPARCPFTREQAMDESFFPDEQEQSA